MTTTRRLLFQAAALLPFSKARAARKTAGVYAQLGIRPVINLAGTQTVYGASKIWDELHESMAEASREYVVLAELQEKVGERLARLTNCESAMVTTGAAGAICLGTCACLTGDDISKVRRLPDLTGMKTEVIIQKLHRNGYDHAVRTAGVRIIEVETMEQLQRACGPQTAMMYFLGGTSHDYAQAPALPLEQCLAVTKKAGVPVLIDAANMLPPWANIPKLGELGVDLIAISGGKHMRGPQCSGILAGRKDLIRAAAVNSNPNSDSLGRPMKAGREEIIGCWLACEKYAKLDFDAIDRQSSRQAAFLMEQLQKIEGLTVEKTPFDRTRRVHRVKVMWDESKLRIDSRQVMQQLRDGEPRIVVLRASPGIEFTVFMNEPGDEKIAARRMREIFKA
jgi:D-glucosaminate-6-phosphate ammonia-lyase